MKIFKIINFFIIILCLFACNKKDDFNYPNGTVGVSKIIYFPTVTLNGDFYILIKSGGIFTDPGAAAQVNGSSVDVAISGAVDVNTPGVYNITYSAKNEQGYTASVSRRVIVYSTDESAAAHDLSGNYARSTNGQLAVWSKIAPGVYKVINPGGAVGATLTVIVFNQTGYEFFIPEQAASDGTITSSSDEMFAPGSPDSYVWVILNPGYGTSLRTFVKQ